MSTTYWVRFSSGDPRLTSGLAPTMVLFYNNSGATSVGPAISEIGTSAGIYTFTWGTTTPMAFLIDAATTGLTGANRYITGALDPADRIDQYGTTLTAIGTTNVALGTTSVALGTTSVSWGSANATSLTNQGTTLVAVGNTSIAQGVIEIGLGTTTVSWVSSIGSTLVAQGTTLVAIGNTAIAIGSTNSQKITNEGVTLSAVGVTLVNNAALLASQGVSLIAIGSTILAGQVNEGITLVAIGNTLASIGSTVSIIIPEIGSTASSFGDQTTDPVDLYGYLKRILENLEGNQTFLKLSGVLDIYSRGSTTLLREKTLANSVTSIIKS